MPTPPTPSLTLTQPDDWHLHLRDGDALAAVAPHTAAQFARAVVMPNLKPPVVDTAGALAYRDRIRAALPPGTPFEPLMTLYLTDHTTPAELRRAKASGAVVACKLYPAGATTNSDAGVTDVRRVDAALDTLAELGLPLLVHGEVTAPEVDIFDREAAFLDAVLTPLLARHPGLRVVLEHITTARAATYVREGPARLAATVTAHHLLVSRNAMLAGGIRPHLYCLPILKRERDRLALLDAATSGSPKFFLGTDSAPHAVHTKEAVCGCAGCFTAHAALELYATAFDAVGQLDKLEGFASHHGPDFYGLPRNTGTVTLTRTTWTPPTSYSFGAHVVRPFGAGEPLTWRLQR